MSVGHELPWWKHLLCNYAGYVLFMPLAFVSHVLWSVMGLAAWGLSKLGCDAVNIKEPYMLVVGPMYVSTKLGRNWNYFGCEPEGINDGVLRIDRGAIAARWSQPPTMNLRGNETIPWYGPTEIRG